MAEEENVDLFCRDRFKARSLLVNPTITIDGLITYQMNVRMRS